MKSFIPVVNLGGRFWSDDRVVWDAIHPGWWSLLERMFDGEAVFDDFPTPYCIVNVPRKGTANEEPGLGGTMDLTEGRVDVVFNSTWGAPIDLVPAGSPQPDDVRRRITDWFNLRAGFTTGILHDYRREAYGCGARVQEVVRAPTFQEAMTRIMDVERRVIVEDRAAREAFQRDLGIPLHHLWQRT